MTNPASVKIYSDGSRIDGGVGAIAVLYINNTPCHTLWHHLGSEKHHRVYEAWLVGLTLAAELLQQLDFLEDMTIATDNQAVIEAVTSFHSAPGQQIIDFFLSQMIELTNWHRGILFQIYWIPGNKGIPGNDKADKCHDLIILISDGYLPITYHFQKITLRNHLQTTHLPSHPNTSIHNTTQNITLSLSGDRILLSLDSLMGCPNRSMAILGLCAITIPIFSRGIFGRKHPLSTLEFTC